MNAIYLTEKDYQRLLELVQAQRAKGQVDKNVIALAEELKRAVRVPAEKILESVVTMNSRVVLEEKKTGSERELTLVYPGEANIHEMKISVLAPVGTAILGCKVGDVVEWPVPAGHAKYIVKQVVFQPEAAGVVHL